MNVKNYQEALLKTLATTKIPVSIYLVNGIRLQGSIDDQDQYTLLLKDKNVSQLVYKHAITTILPSEPLPGLHNDLEEEEALLSEHQ